MSLPVYTYTITRVKLEEARKQLAAKDVYFLGDSGDLSYKGVQLTFEYKEPLLTITIVDSGPYFAFLIHKKITAWFNEV
jgi:hypothetical protein